MKSLIGVSMMAVFALAATAHSQEDAQQPQKREQQRPRKRGPQRDPDALIKRFDENGDGLLDQDESPRPLKRRFDRLDADGDGKLDRAELEKLNRRGRGGGKRPGEVVTRAAPGERYDDTLQVGDPAPDFTLTDSEGKRQVTLSDFAGKKPVVLIFGSYT